MRVLRSLLLITCYSSHETWLGAGLDAFKKIQDVITAEWTPTSLPVRHIPIYWTCVPFLAFTRPALPSDTHRHQSSFVTLPVWCQEELSPGHLIPATCEPSGSMAKAQSQQPGSIGFEKLLGIGAPDSAHRQDLKLLGWLMNRHGDRQVSCLISRRA